jgi:e3 binding domain
MLVEPDISPLAKRLAEENNVNWRGLLGSGAGGKIVERDVLEYLAKVMAGEEDVNPTAEPLPEGMDAWPEDDVQAFYGGAVPAAQAEAPAEEELFVEPNLGSFDAPVAEASSVSHQAADNANFSEDIFLIDEEIPVQSASVDLSDMTEEPAFATEIEPFGEVSAETSRSEATVIDEITGFDDADTEVFSAMSEGSEDLFASDGDVEDLASLFVDDTDEVEATLVEASEPVLDQTVSSTGLSATEFEAPAEPVFDIPTYTPAEDVAHEEVVETLPTEPVEDVVASFESEPVFDSLMADEGFEDLATDDVAALETTPDAPVVESTEMIPETLQAEPELSELSEEHQVEPTVTFSDVAPVVATVAGAGVAASMVEPAVSETPVVTPVAAPVVSSNLPFVSYGVLLRRHVDLSTLVQAQHAIAEEMGQDEPVSVTSFLLRAAAKAQQKVSLVPGHRIGLAVIRNEGVNIVGVNEASSQPFRTVIGQTQQALAAHGADQVDLAVADMSGFDIDEAVLNVGVPVLTLGRTMYDNSKGTHHSTLSLSGNVSIESGTKFLSAVAELLNSPVRLVV